MGVTRDVAINVLANLIFWLGLGGGVSVYVWMSQFRFRRFFGLTPERPLVVCLSNLWSPEAPQRRFAGQTKKYVGASELQAVQLVQGLFSTAAFRIPDAVRGLVDVVWSGSVKIVETRISEAMSDPDAVSHVEGASCIVIGGSRWNRIRRQAVLEELVHLRLSVEADLVTPDDFSEPRFVEIARGGRRGERITSELDLAILEKTRDPATGAVFLFCVGSQGTVSRAATEYLVREWRSLHQEFGDRGFALCLGFQTASNATPSHRRPTRLSGFAT